MVDRNDLRRLARIIGLEPQAQVLRQRLRVAAY